MDRAKKKMNKKENMITTSRLALSAFCIFGAIAFANEINDVDASLLSSATIAVIYQVILAAIGATIFLIGAKSGLIKTTKEVVPVVEEDHGFEIKDVNTDGAEVVGTFGGSNIYNKVKVIFENGFEADYEYDTTIKFENVDKLDVSNLTPGSLILGPGIVYVPVK